MVRSQSSERQTDVLIVGAGPAGIACAIELQREGLNDVLVLDKGCVAQTLVNFPTYMRFFTSSEGLELGGIPMPSQEERPGRTEGVKYYQHLVSTFGLHVRQYEEVLGIRRQGTTFVLKTTRAERRASKVVIATGFCHHPVLLNIPGENAPKVMHSYVEPHAYFDQNVIVVGGRNSAGAAAIELHRAGAHVTIVHRRREFTSSMKPWLREELAALMATGRVHAYFESQLVEVLPDAVAIQTPEGLITVENDFVFALTGSRPDLELLERCGIRFDITGRPILHPQTLESHKPGLYLAGVVVSGVHTNELNISHARIHARRIAEHIASELQVQELASARSPSLVSRIASSPISVRTAEADR